MPEHLSNPTDPTAPPSAPRAMTATASARAWAEPSVRFWWLTSIILVLIAIYLAITGVLTWQKETRLITHGLQVDAVVENIDGLAAAGVQRPVQGWIGISYEIDGKSYRSKGPPPHPKAIVTVKETVPIRVDPDNPQVWTAKPEPMPLSSKFIGPAIALGIMVLTLLAAWLRRRRIARIWQDGAARPAAVVSTGRSGLAPLSHTVTCSPSDARDKSAYTVYYPQRLGKPQAGETIWLLIHPRWPRHALAAAAFAERAATGPAATAGARS